MNIQEALALGNKGIVSIVGAGGKTSLMFALARELVAAGKRVLTATTTKIMQPTREESPAVIIARSPHEIVEKAESLLEKHSHVTAASGYLQDRGKLTGLEFSTIDALSASHLFDFIVIEADGAAGRGLKACASHEPVVYPLSDRVVVVAGLDIVGKPLTEEWVFRSDIYSRITGLEPSRDITEESIASAIIHDLSLIPVSRKERMNIAFLNKADTLKQCQAGERIAALIKKSSSTLFQRIIMGELRTEPVIHLCTTLPVAPTR